MPYSGVMGSEHAKALPSQDVWIIRPEMDYRGEGAIYPSGNFLAAEIKKRQKGRSIWISITTVLYCTFPM